MGNHQDPCGVADWSCLQSALSNLKCRGQPGRLDPRSTDARNGKPLRTCLRNPLGDGSIPGGGGRAAGTEEHRPAISWSRLLPPQARSRRLYCRGRDCFPRLHGGMLQVRLDNGRLGGCWFTVNNMPCDQACTEDHGAVMVGSTTSPMPPTSGRTFSGLPTSSWNAAFTSRPARTSTPSRAHSSSMPGSRLGAGSNTPIPVCAWRCSPAGSR